MPLQLPKLIIFQDYGGDYDAYINAVYAEFFRDFCGQKFLFNGKRVGLKRHPIEQGREATFWHMVSTGNVEADRNIDLRRCERIRWPRAILDNVTDPCLKVWSEERKGDKRIHIFHETEEYLVVVSEREDYVLPWTAYDVPRAHERAKLLRRFNTYG